jgi:hypothetical protein
MKIEAIRSFYLKGSYVSAGEVVDASPEDAELIFGMGKAKEAVVCEVQTKPVKKKTTPKIKKPSPSPLEELEE